MEIKEFNDFESIEDHKKQWDALVKCEKPDQWLFYTYNWYKNWWEAFGKRIKPVIILVFEKEKLVGIAPFGESMVSRFGIPIQQISLLANEHSPKNSVIVSYSSFDAVNNAMEHILNKYPKALIYFEDIADDDPAYTNIMKYVGSNKLNARERVARTTAVIEIKNNWVGYLKEKTKKFRTYTRKIERDYKETNYSLMHYRKPNEISEFFKQGQKIAAHSWQGEINTSIFSKEHLKLFYYGFVELAASEGVLDILCLFNQNEPIAYLFNICINNTLYLIKQEYDSRYYQKAPGFYLDLIAFKESFDKQYKTIDMLGFTTDYKKRWSTELKKDARVYIYQNHRANIISFIDFTIRGTIKKIIRKNTDE